MTLEFVVDEEGATRQVRVMSSSAVDFSAAAVLVVGKMRFTPARVGERKVPVRVVIPVQFQLATAPTPGMEPINPPPMGRERERERAWPE